MGESEGLVRKISPAIIRLVVIIFIIIGVFSLYGNFLVDYSLQSLEFTFRSSKDFDPSKITPIQQRIYGHLVQDIAVEEAFQEKMDLKNLLFIDKAHKSFDQSLGSVEMGKSVFFLDIARRIKKNDRGAILNNFDKVFFMAQNIADGIAAFCQYIYNNLIPTGKSDASTIDYSSLPLLEEADRLEKIWKLDEAENLYKDALLLRLSASDRGFVSLALANLLIKKSNLQEAESLLKRIQSEYPGQHESEIAEKFLHKISVIKQRKKLIQELTNKIQGQDTKTPVSEALKLRLALTHLSIYELDQSEHYLSELLTSRDADMRIKANFYLAWVNDIKNSLDKSNELYLRLLEDPQLSKDMELALKVSLADNYQELNMPDKALLYYSDAAKQIDGAVQKKRIVHDAWISVVELEQIDIYRNDFRNKDKANELLNGLRSKISDESLERISIELKQTEGIDVRALAFEALQQGRVYNAFDLFQKSLSAAPTDAWSHSGLATIYVLQKDSKSAFEYAKKGYEIQPDEYTSAVLGYVYQLMGRDADAKRLLGESLGKERLYTPAGFNLAIALISSREYEQAIKLLRVLLEDKKRKSGLLRSKILNNLACAYWLRGDEAEAVKMFQEALFATPEFHAAKRNLETLAKLQESRMTRAGSDARK